ncbi:ABC transporter ATP-binding protein [Thalassobius sp. S69A]|uniref:ABC transporter ATP-binding protein n=1 Tax=unclassified Thalassovita TaxID=2619711 RepID=UPI000C10C922|nr:microcin ABC transporter ATP-binding protein [Paracoccaceae bacterium]MBT25986.1 microcin ABC transporter ATP-binding protein [Paracoccaceae bacterium]
MSLLQIEGLNLSIHGAPILKNVGLSVAPGQIVGVIGESGSGKSMTAFAALQLLPHGSVCSGRIILNGQDVLNMPEPSLCQMRGRDVGMVFQEPMTALNPIKTIGDQVAETILIHENVSRSEALTRAAEALTRAELPQDRFPLGRYPHELSGGQRQRVVIAMAIALRPKLLIADEPTTALDVTTQAQILTLLRKLVQEEGMGLLLISHDLAVVADMADEIVIMRQGEVVESGAADWLLRNMRHPYSKALLEASAHQPDRSTDEPSEVLLDVRNVVRDYTIHRQGWWGGTQTFRAVKGVSFQLRQGESLGLVGESGCGKSTLTRAILGLEETQGGEIIAFGQRVGRDFPNSLRSGIQVVFQDPYSSFNPRWKVARLVAEPFHLAHRRPDDWRARVAKVLEDVGIGADAMERYIHEFSGGQRQRIAIARALILRPEIVILDEAVSALDVSIRAQILDLLATLQTEYRLAYLFISHDLRVVRSITDRVMVMRAGEIVEQGATAQVFDDPQHDYTQQLIAAAPVLPEDVTNGENDDRAEPVV